MKLRILHLALSILILSPQLQAEAMDSPTKTAEENNNLLTPSDIVALSTPRSPRLSPDGKWIAYTVRSNDLDKDKNNSRIWMTSTDGKDTLALTGEGYNASNPQWSPDGKYLAFMATKGPKAKSQVWRLDMRGGEAQQYTKVQQGVDGFRWAPKGSQMLLLITDPKPDEATDKEDKEEKLKPYVIDRLQFKADYVGYLDRRRTHIYIKADTASAPYQVTYGDFDDNDPVWSPDSRMIAFSSNRTSEPDGNTNSDIWTVSTKKSDTPAALTQVTQNPGEDHSPTWHPDGDKIGHISVINPEKIWYATSHLAVSNAAGSNTKVLTQSLDRHISTPIFTKNGKHIVFSLEDSAEQQLAQLTVKTGALKRLVSGDLAIRSFDYAPSGDTALLVSTPHMPPEVHLYHKGKLTQISHLNTKLLADKELATVKNIHFPSADGTEIEGFLYTPPKYEAGKRYPTILRIHGGPVSQYDFSFDRNAQAMAAAGYVVITTNPRGSSGYGESFSSVHFANWGEKDYEDVMAGIDYAVKEGFADEQRLGVGGWSYGGILTNYVITKTGRFKAAISGASEVNHMANYGHDIYQNFWEREFGLPWENPDAWNRINPFLSLGNVTTPTLIMGGQIDWNVPIQNSEQLYQVLKRRGIPTQLVVYPGESHGIRRPSFMKDRLERYLDWYNQYLK